MTEFLFAVVVALLFLYFALPYAGLSLVGVLTSLFFLIF